MKCTAREKLVEKDIKWGQVYTDKTQFLKDQYNDIIGQGSYFRFEGEASDGDNYYCIIGPARVHKPRAKWFAGVRKLPATYSAGGKYFDSMDGAASYARETWGVPTPKDLKPYTSAQLFGISEKIHKWKAQREENEENEEDKEGKEKYLENKESNTGDISMQSFNLNKFIKEAMPQGPRQENREIYQWFDANDDLDTNPEWQELLVINSGLNIVLGEARNHEVAERRKLKARYGLDPSQIDKCLKTYVGFDINHGAYELIIGPYTGKDTNFLDSWDKFGFYIWRKTYANEEKMQESLLLHMAKYSDKYNMPVGSLTPADFKLRSKSINLDLSMDPNDAGYQDFFSSNNILPSSTQYRFSNEGMIKIIKENWGDIYEENVQIISRERGLSREEAEVFIVQEGSMVKSIFNAIRRKYTEAVASGEAALEGMVPPPVTDNGKLLDFDGFGKCGVAGQQMSTAISKVQKPLLKTMSLDGEILRAMLSGITDPEEIVSVVNDLRFSRRAISDNSAGVIMRGYISKAETESKSLEQIDAEDRMALNGDVLRLMIEGVQNEGEIKKAVNIVRSSRKPVDISVVNSIMQNYVSRGEEEEKSLDELYGDYVVNMKSLREQNNGLNDLKSAFEAMKAYLGHEKFNIATAGFPNITKENVGEIRSAYERAKEHGEPWPPPGGFAPTPETEDEANIEGELEMEIGEVTPDSIPDGDVEPVAPSAHDYTLEDEEEEDNFDPLPDLFNNTMDSLIKISKDLEQDGNKKAVEEVNKIINKYQRRG